MTTEELQKSAFSLGTWIFRGIVLILSWLAIEVFNDMKASVSNIETKFQRVGDDVNSIKVNLGRLEEKVDQSKRDIDRLDRKTDPK